VARRSQMFSEVGIGTYADSRTGKCSTGSQDIVITPSVPEALKISTGCTSVFICALFNAAVHISDCIASNDTMIGE
jgi:hypothetical protein